MDSTGISKIYTTFLNPHFYLDLIINKVQKNKGWVVKMMDH